MNTDKLLEIELIEECAWTNFISHKNARKILKIALSIYNINSI